MRFLALGVSRARCCSRRSSLIFKDTFKDGLTPVWNSLSQADTVHAAKLSLYAMLIAVIANAHLRRGDRALPGAAQGRDRDAARHLHRPAARALARRRRPRRSLLVFANTGWFGTWLTAHGFQVMFAFPSIAIATAFVSLPFVARELIPVLREIGDEQQQAAATLGATRLQTFWRITLPAIRPALTYGIVLTAARALGEYGAVAVVSGAIQGQTETLTLIVQRDWNNFDQTGAYATSLLLAAIAVVVLIALNLMKPAHERQEAT